MTVDMMRDALLWCAVINYSILLWWFLVFSLARNWLYRLHGRWFQLPAERFDAIHYAGMAIYKIGIFLFNLAPWIALRIVA
jgi:hypothetical protein